MSVVQPPKVTGLRDLKASVEAMSGESQAKLDLTLGEVAEQVAGMARRKVPTRTGAARGSLKVRDAAIVAGGSKAPYFGWLDWGGRVGRKQSVLRAWRPEGRYLYPALSSEYARSMAMVEEALVGFVKASGLEVT